MASELTSVVSRAGTKLKAQWQRDGSVLRPGALEADLEAFEVRYGLRLHPEMRAYLGLVDGQDEMDPASYIRFWTLAEIKTAAEELKQPGGMAGRTAGWFVFADFLIWSHAYVIRLSHDPQADAPVGLCHGTLPSDGAFPLIARSFGEFVDLCLNDSPRLHDPWMSSTEQPGRGP
jgi:hypothetical protein